MSWESRAAARSWAHLCCPPHDKTFFGRVPSRNYRSSCWPFAFSSLRASAISTGSHCACVGFFSPTREVIHPPSLRQVGYLRFQSGRRAPRWDVKKEVFRRATHSLPRLNFATEAAPRRDRALIATERRNTGPRNRFRAREAEHVSAPICDCRRRTVIELAAGALAQM